MDHHYLELLPATLQRDVEAIENAIGSEIAITSRPTDVCFAEELAVLICERRESRLVVEICPPASGALSAETLAHEVIHARRNVFEMVERLAVSNGALTETPVQIENDVEHTFVVPEEIGLFPYRRTYWEADLAGSVNYVADKSDQLHPMFIRSRLIAMWLLNDLILPGWSAKSKLREELKKQKMTIKANNLKSKFVPYRRSKSKALAFMLEVYGFEPSRFVLAQWRSDLAADLFKPLPTM